MPQLAPELTERIENILKTDQVVLFMKGNRQQPRCGFSAAVVEMLDELLPSYATVDVLADAEIREGIKAYGEWPTIPQLYIGGELVGGSDITKDLYASGELHSMLGIKREAPRPVTVTVTAAAAAALADAKNDEEPDHQFLRVGVNARFQHSLSFGPEMKGDVAASSEGIEIRLDPQSAKRADGLVIDFVTAPQSGFRLDNPNEPPKVKVITVADLKARLDEGAKNGTPLRLYDVRTMDEWQKARIGGAILLTDAVRDEVASLPKDTPLFFHCHHGSRSQAAAEHYLRLGFKTVYNVDGGVDAWAQQIDLTIARY